MQGRGHGGTTRDTRQDPYDAGKVLRRLYGIFVADRDDLIDHIRVEHLGYEPGADSLNLVGSGGTTGQDR